MSSAYAESLNVSMNARYHQLCEHLFQKANRIALFITLFAGSGAFVGALAGDHVLTGAAGLLVGAVSALDISLGTNQRAVQHHELYRRYLSLDRRIVLGEILAEKEILAERQGIEMDEPPPFPAVLEIAYRRNLDTLGHEEVKHRPLSFVQQIVTALV